MNPTEPIIIGVSHQIGHYADAIRVPVRPRADHHLGDTGADR